jgi:hypothetical protein
LQAHKNEIVRLQLEAEQARMHVKELLFTQKLERSKMAQMIEQKRVACEEREDALAQTRELQQRLRLQKVNSAALEARIRHADEGLKGLKGLGDNSRQATLDNLHTQLNNLKVLNDDLWERLHTANKHLADSSEEGTRKLNERDATIEQMRATIAKMEEEQNCMWEQASQMTMRSLAQHQRELLHSLEIETLKAATEDGGARGDGGDGLKAVGMSKLEHKMGRSIVALDSSDSCSGGSWSTRWVQGWVGRSSQKNMDTVMHPTCTAVLGNASNLHCNARNASLCTA